jgi:hypothetical protein
MSGPLQIVLRPSSATSSAEGDPGWSPVLAIVNHGDRRVIQVVDWTGGGGSKPAGGVYLGTSGYTTNIADAADIRGPIGPDNSVVALDSLLLRNTTTGSIWRLSLVGDSDDTTEPKWFKQ